jgi:hypothetical protein
MDKLDVPSLNRKSREADSRSATARRKPWAPPSKLDAPAAPPGYKHRWIRAEANGYDDRINVASRLREGYELVRSDEYPDFLGTPMEGSRHAGVLGVGGLLLARIPEETVAERNAYYTSRTRDQLQAVDNDLMKANAHDSMRINKPSRQSRTVFGSPKADE